MEKIIIASKNPAKVNAVKIGFQKTFPNSEFEFVGVNAPSDVSDQPMSNKETLQGAINRVSNAKAFYENADYRVGLEGGIERVESEIESFARAVILNKNGVIGKAKTCTYFLPTKFVELINQGKTLAECDEILFSREDARSKDGAVGLLTKNAINRPNFHADSVVFALIPFLNKGLFL